MTSDPGYLEARFSLANALRRNGRVEASLPHYAEVLRINPAVSQASFGYAMGLVRLGRYQEARDRLDRDVRAFPDQLGFAHALARLLSAAPDDRVRDGARADAIMTALLKNQQTPALAETMAMTQAELGRFKRRRPVAANGDRPRTPDRPPGGYASSLGDAAVVRKRTPVPHAVDERRSGSPSSALLVERRLQPPRRPRDATAHAEACALLDEGPR